MITTNR